MSKGRNIPGSFSYFCTGVLIYDCFQEKFEVASHLNVPFYVSHKSVLQQQVYNRLLSISKNQRDIEGFRILCLDSKDSSISATTPQKIERFSFVPASYSEVS
jgi:hypothetical protein